MASTQPTSSPTTSTYTVSVPGSYGWQLLLEMDNTTGKEYVTEHTVATSMHISRRSAVAKIIRTLREDNKEFRSRTEAVGSLRFVDFTSQFETGFIQHNSLLAELSMHDEEDFEMDKNQYVSEKITVPAGERFTLYQLRFDGLGSSAVFNTKSSSPRTIPAGRIECMVEVEAVPPGPPPAAPGPIPEGKYALRTYHGTFVSAKPGGEGASVDLQASCGGFEEWTLVRIRGSIYGLRSCHGTYLRAWPGGEGAKLDLQVDKHNWDAMGWEQFTIVPITKDRFGIRSCHGTYIRACPEGKLDLQVDKHNWASMAWEHIAFQDLQI
ncbi:hypothetical protein CBR_g45616 [Chara braunii]|uniref:Uncharacterized protein n=1 Tax=Chara braunii TaxID=69332 RepID=A0A388LZ05_CHABU|nr:hypothetical protein CBR_g45616 [Chara braunii]|eukprot:GBG87558.1 hypothetical protein CBR_g45616 [Chara braunii]